MVIVTLAIGGAILLGLGASLPVFFLGKSKKV